MKIKLHVLGFPEPLLIDGSTELEKVMRGLKTPGVLSLTIDGRIINVVSTAICGWEPE